MPGPEDIILEHHIELVWRIGVKPINQEDMERLEESLVSRLEGRVYIIDGGTCIWSEPDETHLVVIAYEGVVTWDLSVDPDDHRFQAFAVGYGSSWEDAEAEAVAKARLNMYVVGSGYDVMVRETWDNSAPVTAARQGQAGWPETAADAAEPEPEPEPRSIEPGTVFRDDCAACPEMVVVPAGSFMMGSPESEEERNDDEGPRHRVTIGSPFAVGVYEVTFEEWDACVRAGGCGGYRPEDAGWGRGSRPVIDVSWEDAREYVRWLSRETGEEYRLLTEAEWEYVARAGTQTARYWGESETGQCRYGNGYDRIGHAEWGFNLDPVSCSDGYVHTAPVGMFEPNAFGLYDVLGNVREWTQDCWNDGYSDAPTDGSAWRSGDCTNRVLRGGSWNGPPWRLRSAYRSGSWAEYREQGNHYLGFRAARTLN
ncbi:MAG: formylglycine-generating enzyme family protein [Gemmatimonadetes bacterium]|nr:formylglycine-generating enzyme family protein [Gemmatimonadota bacterium]